ncbi:MAG: hypothetical protein WD939_02960 [Dehalococcoidia bacterium]
MPRFLRMIALLAGALLMVVLLAACGGDDGGDDGEPTETPAATEVVDGEPDDEPTDTPGLAAEQPFDSYHYEVEVGFTVTEPGEESSELITVNVEGDYAGPDSHSFTNSFSFAGISATQDVVIIGDDAWFRESGGDWTATTALDPEVLDSIDLTSADPGFLQDSDLANDFASLDSEPEERNGVQTRRYFIPKEAVEALVDILGEDFLSDTGGLQEFEMTVWLEEESDALIRAELEAVASPELLGDEPGFSVSPDAVLNLTMLIDVTQINDSGISIEPPI